MNPHETFISVMMALAQSQTKIGFNFECYFIVFVAGRETTSGSLQRAGTNALLLDRTSWESITIKKLTLTIDI